MKKVICFLFLFCFFPCMLSAKTKIYVFHGEGCPHCAEEQTYLEELKNKYSDLEVVLYEVWNHKQNAIFMERVKEKLNQQNPYVPFTVIGQTGLTGFSENTKLEIERLLSNCEQTACVDMVEKIKNEEDFVIEKTALNPTKKIPILGTIDVTKFSLPFITIVMGVIDGFNPCAMWVLVFLITLLIGTKDKKRMILLGSTFLLVSGLLYFLILTTWVQVSMQISSIIWIRNLIALLAISIGLWNLKKAFFKKEIGCNATNSEQKQKIMKKMRQLIAKEHLGLAILGMALLAISINLVEFTCSAGFPLLYSEILNINQITGISSILWMLLYVFFYMLDDFIIFFLAVCTLKITGISNRYTKYVSILGGIILLSLGMLLLLKPEWILFSF